jgi:hypothetical protein
MTPPTNADREDNAGPAHVEWLRLSRPALDFNGPMEVLFAPLDTAAENRALIELLRDVTLRCPDRIAVDDGYRVIGSLICFEPRFGETCWILRRSGQTDPLFR